jgi:putative tryptophan/tyrosine transport system substrate-binding protein
VPSLLTHEKRDFIISLANRHRLPNVYAFRYYPASGGLASYGVDNIGLYKSAASYVDQFSGARSRRIAGPGGE